MSEEVDTVAIIGVSVLAIALFAFLYNLNYSNGTTYPPIVLEGPVRNTTQYDTCSSSCWKLPCLGPNDCLMQDCLDVCKLQDKGER